MNTFKLYAYIGIAVAVAGLFTWYTVHERGVEHSKDVAAAEVVVKKDNAIVVADQATAQTSETSSAIIFKQAVSIPAVADLGVSCVRIRPAGSVSLPAAQPIAGAAVGDVAADSGSGSTYDPSGALLDRAKLADAEIEYLQRRIGELEAEMNSAP